MDSQVSIVDCNSYESAVVTEAVTKAVDLIGGIENFIKPQSKVLVKPNLLMAKAPEFAITTHPEVIRAVVKLLKGINCRIFLGDGPSVWGNQIEDVDSVYEHTGIKRIAEEEGIELVKFEKRRWHGKFPLTTWLDECDYLVNLPKFKTHDFTILTGAIKNLFGLVVGTYKTELHKNYFHPEDFAKILVDIFQKAKPQLTIIDGILAMEGDGPGSSGKLRNLNLLLASSDCVALDSLMAKIMGIEPEAILTTKEASSRGLGIAEINSIEVLGEKLADLVAKPFILPTTSFKNKLPPVVIKMAKKLIKFYPYLQRDNCIRCAACIQACPNQAISLEKKGIIFDYTKCLSCFCCQEACPASAIKVKKSLFANLIGL